MVYDTYNCASWGYNGYNPTNITQGAPSYEHSPFFGGVSTFIEVGIMNMSANPDHPFHVAVGNNKVDSGEHDLSQPCEWYVFMGFRWT